MDHIKLIACNGNALPFITLTNPVADYKTLKKKKICEV